MPGDAKGIAIFLKIWKVEAPSIFAASRVSEGNSRKNDHINHITKGKFKTA